MSLVFDEIKSEIYTEKQYNLVSDYLRNLADNYKDFDPEQHPEVIFSKIENVAKDTKLTKIDNYDLNKEIFSLSSKGDYTKCYKDDTRGYLAILLNKNRADKDYYNDNYYTIQGEYRNNALTNYFSSWIEDEVDNAKVKIWFKMKDIYKGKY